MVAETSRCGAAEVLVIGGGIAGASCALELARHRVNVTLVERSRFPRAKVCGCCVSDAGLRLLDQCSLKQQVLSRGQVTDRWIASFDGRRVEIPVPIGVAISREVFDPMLIDAAAESGAAVAMQTQGTIDRMLPDGVLVTLLHDGQTVQKQFDAVVVAAGLSAGRVQELLPWTDAPHGPFGVSCTARSDDLRPGAIYMACDDDGYVGMVQLADGQTDIAAALRPGSIGNAIGDPLARMQQILGRSGLPLPDFQTVSPVITTPPLRRTRRFGNARVIAIGDAAGYVEPFTGEGMTWAMASGIAAANRIATANDLRLLGDQWQLELQQLLDRKKRLCRIVTTACRSSLLRRFAGHALIRFPGLARPLLRELSRGV
ncbi:FAD-dependent oxidoreductase [Stieleria sp. TO1_6]|nr:FAD-dependent oxidoreductase [Stieleria tagensis]